MAESANEHDAMNGKNQSITLTPEDIERLKDGETVEFSHVLEGYRLSVDAEQLRLSDFVKEDEDDE